MILITDPVLNAEQRAAVDALSGHFKGRSGAHFYQKMAHQIEEHSLSVSAAQVDRHTWLQALVLCSIAACRGWEKDMRTVVCVFNRCVDEKGNKGRRKGVANRRIRLPRWRDLPNHIRLTFALAAGMSALDAIDYTPICLNLSEEDAAQHPESLTEKIRKRLYVALDAHIPFVIERDDKGRSHVHAIYLGTLTRQQRARLKKAGGKIEGPASQFQLWAPPKEGITFCLGWTRYMQKEAKAHIPNEMRSAGEALYKHVRALINEINTAPTTRNPKPATSTYATCIPLEENSPILSPRHEIGAAISKIETSEDEFDRLLDDLRHDLHMDDIGIYAPWPTPVDAGANLATKMSTGTAMGDNTLQSNHTSNCANMDELDQWLDQMFAELMQEAA